MAKKILDQAEMTVIYNEAVENLKNYKKVEKSINKLFKNALNNHGKSLYVLGIITRSGYRDIKKNTVESKKYLTRAFDLLVQEKEAGDAAATYMVGTYYFYGYGNVEQDIDEAIKILDLAYNLGDVEAAKLLYNYYKENEENELAEHYSQLALNSDYKPVVENKVVETAKVSSSAPEVREESEAIIKSNYQPFTSSIDEIKDDTYYDFKIREKHRDNNKVIGYINKINRSPEYLHREELEKLKVYADAGSLDAATYIGCYFNHRDSQSPENEQIALHYLNKAIELGSISSIYELGLLYINSTSELKDEHKGLNYVDTAARKGYTKALEYLGNVYHEGKFVFRNDSIARKFYILAANRGLGSAYYHLAQLDFMSGHQSEGLINLQKARVNGYSC